MKLRPFIFPRNLKNSIASFLDVFIYPVLFFSLTPFFIDRLGEKTFGVWLFVNSIMISMQIFNLGLGTAVLKNVAKHIGAGDRQAIADTINTNFSLSSIIHIVCFVTGIVIAAGISFAGFFRIERDFVQLASIGAAVGGILVGFKFYEQIISYTFKAFERFEIAALINSGVRMVILLTDVVLVWAGQGLLVLLSVNVLLSLAGVVAGFIMLQKQLPYYRFKLMLKKSLVKEELAFALWTWFQSLAVIFTFQFDRFFVLTQLGLKTLTYYGLVATMFNHIHMGFNSIVPWLAPKITKLQARGKDVSELYFNSRNVSLALGLLALMVFSLVYTPVFKILLGNEKFALASNYILLFILFELFFIYAIVPGYFLNAAGHEKLYFKIVLLYCFTIVSGMLAGFYFTHRKAEGLLIGMTAATGITMILQNQIINRKVFGIRGWADTIKLFTPVICIFLMVLADHLLIKAVMVIISVFAMYLVFIRYYKVKLLKA